MPSTALPGPAKIPTTADVVAVPDLELQVHLTAVDRAPALTYVLHSARAGFHFETIRGPALKIAPEAYAALLLQQIERLHEGYGVDREPLLLAEAEKELESLGRSLYCDLFPREMKQAYRRWRGVVRTVQITSDEPAIPWELVKPYDDEEDPLIDDDFFCIRFQLTRWRNGRAPLSAFQVRKLACFANPTLPNAANERNLLSDLATRHPVVEDASPRSAEFRDIEQLLKMGGCDLLHFIGHGDVYPGQPSEAKVVLEGRPFRARHLTGEIQTQLKKDRPLVFLNACRVASQSWSLTGLGGWIEAWVRTCECGGFLGPQWIVRDSLAYAFAQVFYYELEQGRTLGEATQTARWKVKELDPGRPTWLAFAVYGHPNARLSFGAAAQAPAQPWTAVLDAEAASYLASLAITPAAMAQVVAFLEEILKNRPDPSERYWAYVALGKIGGPQAEKIVRHGLADHDAFAKHGAERALRILQEERDDKNPS